MPFSVKKLESNSPDFKPHHVLNEAGRPIGLLINSERNENADAPGVKSLWMVMRIEDSRHVHGWDLSDWMTVDEAIEATLKIPTAAFKPMPQFMVSANSHYGLKGYISTDSGCLIWNHQPQMMTATRAQKAVELLKNGVEVLMLPSGDEVTSYVVSNLNSGDIEQLADEYLSILSAEGHVSKQDPDGSDTPAHLMWMLQTLKEGKGMSLTKRHRWFGFVQDALKNLGMLTVKAERERTRGIFNGN